MPPRARDDNLPEKAARAWAKATLAQKEDALKRATQFIDTLSFKGRRLKGAQALSWPRVGALRDDGTIIVGVPIEIKEATSLVAGFILAEVPWSESAAAYVLLVLGDLVDEPGRLFDGHVGWH
jgi:hypothetical protein